MLRDEIKVSQKYLNSTALRISEKNSNENCYEMHLELKKCSEQAKEMAVSKKQLQFQLQIFRGTNTSFSSMYKTR